MEPGLVLERRWYRVLKIFDVGIRTLANPIVIYYGFARDRVFAALRMISRVTLHYWMLSIRELCFLVYLHHQHMLHVLG